MNINKEINYNKPLGVFELFSLTKEERKKYCEVQRKREKMLENTNFWKQRARKIDKDRALKGYAYTEEELLDGSWYLGKGKVHRKAKKPFLRKLEEKKRIKRKLDYDYWHGVSRKTNKDTGEEYFVQDSGRNKFEREMKKRHRKGTRRALNRYGDGLVHKNGANYKKVNKNWSWY